MEVPREKKGPLGREFVYQKRASRPRSQVSETWLLRPRHQAEAGACKGLPVALTPRSHVCPQDPLGGSLCGHWMGAAEGGESGQGRGHTMRHQTICHSEPLIRKVDQRHPSHNLRFISEISSLRVSWEHGFGRCSPSEAFQGHVYHYICDMHQTVSLLEPDSAHQHSKGSEKSCNKQSI